MNKSDEAILGDTIDKSQVPSIQQKRMMAFVNHFIVNTVTFLNKFIANCETKFIEFESKLQKVEASLLIVESKLASISGVRDTSKSSPSTPSEGTPNITENIEPANDVDKASVPKDEVFSTKQELPSGGPSITEVVVPPVSSEAPEVSTISETVVGIKACEDARYRKYFKMNHFGVPLPAVKIKMETDGFDPTILDDPNRILEDGVTSVEG